MTPRGSVLIIAIAVVLILSGLLLVFIREMRVEAQLAANRAANIQAGVIARGVVTYVTNQLTSSTDPITLDTSMFCEANPLGDGYFWILRPDVSDETKYAFGLTDEASKININVAPYNTLVALPSMTTDLAASIVDWRDSDDDVSNQGGAESEFYLQQNESYYCKNAPFETPEEILLLNGATTDLIYGIDANHNGVVDPGEDDSGAGAAPGSPALSGTGSGTGVGAGAKPGSSTGSTLGLSSGSSSSISGFNGNVRCGVMKYMTIYSQESNVSSTGKARTNLNLASNQQIEALLKKYVTSAQLAVINTRLRTAKPFRSLFDFYYKMGLTPAIFAQIADTITVNPAKTIQGLINVNTAPKEVLECLPGMAQGDGDSLVAYRANGSDLSSIAWVLNVLTPVKAASICNYITVKATRFSADIVAVSGDGRGFKRLKVVFDATATPPKILYSKDLTHLGWPLDPGILAELRLGRAPTATSESTALPQGSGSGGSGGSSLGGSGMNLGGSR